MKRTSSEISPFEGEWSRFGNGENKVRCCSVYIKYSIEICSLYMFRLGAFGCFRSLSIKQILFRDVGSMFIVHCAIVYNTHTAAKAPQSLALSLSGSRACNSLCRRNVYASNFIFYLAFRVERLARAHRPKTPPSSHKEHNIGQSWHQCSIVINMCHFFKFHSIFMVSFFAHTHTHIFLIFTWHRHHFLLSSHCCCCAFRFPLLFLRVRLPIEQIKSIPFHSDGKKTCSISVDLFYLFHIGTFLSLSRVCVGVYVPSNQFKHSNSIFIQTSQQKCREKNWLWPTKTHWTIITFFHRNEWWWGNAIIEQNQSETEWNLRHDYIQHVILYFTRANMKRWVKEVSPWK